MSMGGDENMLILGRDGTFFILSERENWKLGVIVGRLTLETSRWPYTPTLEMRAYVDALYNELRNAWNVCRKKEGNVIKVRFLPS